MPTDPTEMMVEVLMGLEHPEDEAREIERDMRELASGLMSPGERDSGGSVPLRFGPPDTN